MCTLALETELLVLAGHVISEQLQGLPHRSLGIGPKVRGMLLSNDLDNDFTDELQVLDRDFMLRGMAFCQWLQLRFMIVLQLQDSAQGGKDSGAVLLHFFGALQLIDRLQVFELGKAFLGLGVNLKESDYNCLSIDREFWFHLCPDAQDMVPFVITEPHNLLVLEKKEKQR